MTKLTKMNRTIKNNWKDGRIKSVLIDFSSYVTSPENDVWIGISLGMSSYTDIVYMTVRTTINKGTRNHPLEWTSFSSENFVSMMTTSSLSLNQSSVCFTRFILKWKRK